VTLFVAVPGRTHTQPTVRSLVH